MYPNNANTVNVELNVLWDSWSVVAVVNSHPITPPSCQDQPD